MKKNIIFVILFCTGIIYSQPITTNILQRVFLVKYKDSLGTIFTIEYENKQYLVSAAHIFDGIADKDTIQIFYKSDWSNLNVTKIGHVKKDVDIIVFTTNIQLSPTYDIIPTMDKIYFAQDVYFLGFPFGITNDVQEINNYFPLPLIKKGILSTILGMGKDAIKIMYIDGINNKGFSGGPIVFYDQSLKKLKIAGVVSAYRNQYDKVILNGKETPLQAVTNSGFLIGYSIEHAIEAIKENPVGFLINK